MKSEHSLAVAHQALATGRKARGVSTLILVMVLAVFVVMPLGAVAFELVRFNFAQEQLRVATDAAVLAAHKVRTNLSLSDPANAESRAWEVGMSVFRSSSVMGTMLTSTNRGALTGNSLPVGNAHLDLRFLHGRTEAAAWFGLSPAFPGIFGSQARIVGVDVSACGLPKLDVVVCLDLSHSMINDTPIRLVRRVSDGDPKKAETKIKHKPIAAGRIVDLGWPGAPFYPQELGHSYYLNSARPYIYRRGLRSDLNWRADDVGRPSADEVNPVLNGFTDLVADLPTEVLATSSFFSVAASWPPARRAGLLAEALRGNLESPSLYQASKAETAFGTEIQPRPGFQREYLRLAKLNAPPFSNTLREVKDFLSRLEQAGDIHLGLVSFAGRASKANRTSIDWFKTSYLSPGNGTMNFSYPHVALNQADHNFDQVRRQLFVEDPNNAGSITDEPNTAVFFGTDTAGALSEGVRMLADSSKARPGVKKVIILLTDGLPYWGAYMPGYPLARRPEGTLPAENATYQAARQAKKDGVTIHAIGFLHVRQSDKVEGARILRKVRKLAGNGSTYHIEDNVQGVREALAKVLDGMVRLVN